MGTLIAQHNADSADASTSSAARTGPSARWRQDPYSKIQADGITFDDVLLVPRRSGVVPGDTDVSARLTGSIRLGIPLISAPMDTVTESALAIALAQEGGIGIIHKNMPAEVQAREVTKVKRSANGVIVDPITLGPADTVGRARELMRRHHVSGFPVTDSGSADIRHRGKGKVVGILTRRDLKFVADEGTPVRDVMTATGLVTASPETTLAEAEDIVNKNKVEKLLLVHDDMTLAGLITMRDIDRLSQFPRANTDDRGRLRCGAAVGVRQFERVEALIAAGVDVITVDTAHGHSENVIETVREIKRLAQVEVIAGNVATAEGARDLVKAGADAVKVGIGPGSICTTRVVTGVGVPQISAVMNAVAGVAGTGRDVPRDRRRRDPSLGRHLQGARRGRRGVMLAPFSPGWTSHRASWSSARPPLQELPRHGLGGRDERRLRRPLRPGRQGRNRRQGRDEIRARGRRGAWFPTAARWPSSCTSRGRRAVPHSAIWAARPSPNSTSTRGSPV